MSNPFAPTYFVDFYKNHPADKHAIMELNRDMWSEEEKAARKFWAASVTSVLAIGAYTVAKGPMPILAKYGRIFGTHRVFRHYAYAVMASAVYAYAPFYNTLHKNEAKLKEIAEFRANTVGEFMEPSKPISYSYKHY